MRTMSTAPKKRRSRTRRTSIFLGERHAPLISRVMAKAIDTVIVTAMFFLGAAVWTPFGLVVAVLFAGVQDGMWVGQSIGKRIIGLRVIEDHRGLPCGFRNSLLRNIPFMLAIPFAGIPILWAVFLIAIVPILVLESYLVASLESGTRLGDILGNTLVVEYLDDGMHQFN
ncbi:MAG: RDD family protein [Bdellovibrionales bacterium]|nr:RDD family protein [Bdellovibrionales bacterium]